MDWKLGWKTILGGIVLTLGELTKPEVLNLLSPKVAGFLTAIGILLSIVGLRHAQAKIDDKVETVAGIVAEEEVK